MIRRLRLAWLAILVALAGAPTAALAQQHVPPPPSHTHARAVPTGVVNINQASTDALELLPGIGPTKAERIVEQRTKHPFKKVDDLTKVKGIGKKTMVRLRPFLTVTGNTTLTVDKPGDGD